MVDKYMQFYGKSRKELEYNRMMFYHVENYGYLTQLANTEEISTENKDIQVLDHAMLQQALDLEKIRTQMETNLYAEDGSIKASDLSAYLKVLKQFSHIYDRTNATLARRYLIHK